MAFTGSNTHSAHLVKASNQYFSRANGTFYDSTTGTFECWVYLTTLPTATSTSFAIVDWSGSGSAGINVLVSGGTNKVQAYFGAAGNIITSTTVLAVTTWYHIAYAYDTTEAKLYINGVLEATAGAATLAAGAATIYIGNETDTTLPFNGNLDDVRIWNTKRTITQISTNMSITLVGNESGLISYWKLDNAVTDSTSNGKTLTNNNTATFQTSPLSPANIYSGTQTETVTGTEALTTFKGNIVAPSLETITMSEPPLVVGFVISPTVEVVTGSDSVRTRFNWNDQSKSTSTWANQTKN